MRVTKTEEVVQFDKRQGLPFLIEAPCPACKMNQAYHLGSRHYLGNNINLHGTTLFHACCFECGQEWPLKLKIRVSLEVEAD